MTTLKTIRGPGGRSRQDGQALAEFALVVPMIVLIVVACLDLGRVIWTLDALSNAAREAARYAIVHGDPAPGAADIKAKATSWQSMTGSTFTATLCYGSVDPTTAVLPASCTADTSASYSSYPRGTPVTVVVRSSVGLVTGAFLGLGPFALEGSASMVVSN